MSTLSFPRPFRYRLDPSEQPNEAQSRRYADGSALLIYECGALVKIDKRSTYEVTIAPESGGEARG